MIWDAATGIPDPAVRFKRHWTIDYDFCAFSPDSSCVAAGNYNAGGLFVWSASSGNLLAVFEPQHTKVEGSGRRLVLSCVAFGFEGRFLVAGTFSGALLFFSVGEKTERFSLTGHTDIVRCCAVEAEGVLALSGGDDATLRVWNVTTQECTQTLTGHSKLVSSCAFSPDSSMAVSASADLTVRVWGIACAHGLAAELCRFTGHSLTVLCCAFAPDGKTVAAGGQDLTLRLWSLPPHVFERRGDHPRTGAADHGSRGESSGGSSARAFPHSKAVTCLAASADGSRVVSGSADGSLVLWDAATGGKLGALLPGHDRRRGPMGGGVSCCAISADGSVALSGGCSDKVARLWDLLDGGGGSAAAAASGAAGAARFDFRGHSGEVSSCALSADSAVAVTCSKDAVHVWNPATGEERHRLRFPESTDGGEGPVEVDWDFREVVISPNLDLVVAGGGFDRRRLAAWDVASGAQRWAVRHTEKSIGLFTSLCFSPDGTSILHAASMDDSRIHIRDAASGEERLVLRGGCQFAHGTEACRFSPDGLRVLSGGKEGLAVWSAETGARGATLVGHGGAMVRACEWVTSDLAVSCALDRTIRWWCLKAPKAEGLGRPLRKQIAVAVYSCVGLGRLTLAATSPARPSLAVVGSDQGAVAFFDHSGVLRSVENLGNDYAGGDAVPEESSDGDDDDSDNDDDVIKALRRRGQPAEDDAGGAGGGSQQTGAAQAPATEGAVDRIAALIASLNALPRSRRADGTEMTLAEELNLFLDQHLVLADNIRFGTGPPPVEELRNESHSAE